MRRILGLQDASTTSATFVPSGLSSGAHPQRRRFVRDGEVPVTVMHRTDGEGAGTNKLDAARQALREQTAACEHAEQLLQDARATTQDLQTKLAHERFAKEEAVRQAEAERQVIQDELAGERLARQQADQELDRAVVARQDAEERLRAMVADQQAQLPSAVPPTLNPARKARTARGTVQTIHAAIVQTGGEGEATARTPVTEVPGAAATAILTRRRGRPPKVRQPEETDFVEWWKPGWRDRIR
jgi:hypothetical protein